MQRIFPAVTFCAAALVGSLFLSGCGAPSNNTSNGSTGGSNLSTPSGDGSSNDGGNGSDSVGDVSNGGGGSTGGQSSDTIRAKIRNEGTAQADVTLRFIRNNVVVHLAFVRAMPETITTVVSPQMSDQLELSGVDNEGKALIAKTLHYGQDFDTTRPAEYTITRPPTPPGNGGSGDPGPVVDPPPVDVPGNPAPHEPAPVSITLSEPSGDVSLSLGATFAARWTDVGEAPGASVVIGLRRVGLTGIVPVTPALAAGLDGLNDEVTVVVQGIQPGTYEVLATISAEGQSDTSVAPGRVIVEVDPSNVAPTLTILSPTTLTELNVGDDFVVTWSDADPDDNATIRFQLVPSQGSDPNLGSFEFGPPVAENPDGPSSDRLRVSLDYVLPGEYDLVGTIDDGVLIGTARVEYALRLLAVNAPLNDAPQLTITQPGADVIANPGGAFLVAWTDSDANDNARISIMLDPDLVFSEPDGDEIVLVGSLSEDSDGLADSISLGLPNNLAIGSYRVVGVITDGLVQSTVIAPGILIVAQTEPSEDPGNDDPAPLPSVVLTQPTQPVRTRMSGTFPVRLEVHDMPLNADVHFFLDNTNSPGGTHHVDVTPDNFSLTQVTGSTGINTVLTIPENFPQNAWPRRFNLSVTMTVGTTTYTSVALAPVWVRQEVSIVGADMINYWCTPLGGGSNSEETFAGLRITWTGGGFGDSVESLDPVRFWLSADGAIPASGQNDNLHRMITASQVEALNSTRLSDITVPSAFGLEYIRVGNYLEMHMALDPGEYYLLTEVHDDTFGQVISPAFDEMIDACFPLPNAGISLDPP